MPPSDGPFQSRRVRVAPLADPAYHPCNPPRGPYQSDRDTGHPVLGALSIYRSDAAAK